MNVASNLDLLSITGLSHDGRGVGHLNGKTCFVPDAIPGDEVKVRIIEENQNYNVAKMLERSKDSPERVTPFCPLFGECGGCQLQHQSLQAQRFWKEANFFDALNKGLDMRKCQKEAPLIGEGQAYRRRARFVWGRNKADKAARFGFRIHNSNDIVDVKTCPILVPELNDQLTLKRPEYLETASRQFKEVTWIQANEGILSSHDVMGNLQPDEGHYSIGELSLAFSADGFIQVNEALNLQMIQQAQAWLDLSKTDTVLDLFCGVGNFSLPMAQKAKSVVGIEGEADLVNYAKENALNNQLSEVQFFKANLFEDMTKSQWFLKQTYDKILLDPGRQGAQLMCENMAKLKPQKIVYVSCNAATLIRDAKILAKQGYQIRKANMIDMFAHTTHAEVMVLFQKTQKSSANKKRRVFKL